MNKASKEKREGEENHEISIKDNQDLEFFIREEQNIFRKLAVEEIKKYSLSDTKTNNQK